MDAQLDGRASEKCLDTISHKQEIPRAEASQMGRHILSISVSTLVIALATSSGSAQEPSQYRALGPPDETVISADTENGRITLRLQHEVINDPADSPLFNIPGDVDIAPGGDILYVDPGDNTVHVLDPNGEHRLDIGSPGQGPGEFEGAWLVAVSSNERVHVLDRNRRSIDTFDLDGQFITRRSLPVRGSFNATGMEFIDDSTLVVSGTSLVAPFHGYGLHVFNLKGVEIAHERSFAETPKMDPVLYQKYAYGMVRLDLDGGLLYNQITPYSLRKYTPDGDLVWRLDDPELVPPATKAFGVSASGRILARRYAYSAAFLPIQGGDYYLHIMMFPPPQAREGERVLYERRFELVRCCDDRGRPTTRVLFDVADPLLYVEVDRQGRLYGLWHEWDYRVIRSSITIDRSE